MVQGRGIAVEPRHYTKTRGVNSKRIYQDLCSCGGFCGDGKIWREFIKTRELWWILWRRKNRLKTIFVFMFELLICPELVGQLPRVSTEDRVVSVFEPSVCLFIVYL